MSLASQNTQRGKDIVKFGRKSLTAEKYGIILENNILENAKRGHYRYSNKTIAIN